MVNTSHTRKDHGMFIYYLHLLIKIFQQNQFQPLFSFYKYTFSFSLKGIYIYIYNYLFTSITISEQLDQENCGSLVLLDENIYTSSYENQKGLLHLK